jgi:hypothetical protein
VIEARQHRLNQADRRALTAAARAGFPLEHRFELPDQNRCCGSPTSQQGLPPLRGATATANGSIALRGWSDGRCRPRDAHVPGVPPSGGRSRAPLPDPQRTGHEQYRPAETT